MIDKNVRPEFRGQGTHCTHRPLALATLLKTIHAVFICRHLHIVSGPIVWSVRNFIEAGGVRTIWPLGLQEYHEMYRLSTMHYEVGGLVNL